MSKQILKNVKFEYEDTMNFDAPLDEEYKKAREEQKIKSEIGEIKPKRKKKNFKYKINFRKIIFLVSAFALCLALIFLIVNIIYKNVFKITRIEIDNLNGYEYEDIIAVTGIKTGKNIDDIDFTKIKNNIMSHYGYVSNVSIEKEYPNIVHIYIEWSTPYYYLEVYGDYLTLDKDLRVLDGISENDAKENGLVKIISGDIKKAVIGNPLVLYDEVDNNGLYELIESINKTDLKQRVNEINIIDTFSVVIYCDEVYKIKLGSIESIKLKIEFVSQTMQDKKFNGEKPAVLTVSSDMKNIYVSW